MYSRRITSWRVDEARLAAAVDHFAPSMTVGHVW
jgi:hypothetical protein